jgi:hypothetical protein
MVVGREVFNVNVRVQGSRGFREIKTLAGMNVRLVA